MNAIQIQEVTKMFGGVAAVNDLSLSIPEGSIYGFIGPNGSGKTTTMRMIVGILRPDRGSIAVPGEKTNGVPIGRIGYLPEERGLYRKMRLRTLLEFHGELRGGLDVSGEVTEWLQRLGLAEWADKPVEALSKGMSQKAQFIAAVLCRPPIVILDEPFSGLDPVAAETLREAILELRRRGTTVVLSTHDMPTAEAMCDFIFMIFRGRKVLDGSLAEIQEMYGSDIIRLSTANGSVGGGHDFSGLPGVEQVRDLGQVQELRLARGSDPQLVLRELVSRTQLTSFALAKPSLHDIFLRIAGPASAGAPEVTNETPAS
ncbi:MAG: ATP-binding cassette domain-containing protein [Acidobacteriia bacterium]|nr:ATP-binding cassette domain-containing protein [Terriglobia bacterium]